MISGLSLSLQLVMVWYALVNVTAALLVVVDKLAARAGTWRVAEKTMHLLALLGGWPVSAVVQRLVRHKTRKRGFQLVFWFCAALHCAAAFGVYQWVRHNY